MTTTAYTQDERAAWRACRDYLRTEIEGRAMARKPHKLAMRRGEYPQGTVAYEGNHLRALYLLYGLLRGKAWSYVEAGHEPIMAMRPYLVAQWAAMVKAGHSPEAPVAIAEWVQ